MKPVRAELKLRNNRILKLKEASGLTVRQLAVKAGIHWAEYYSLAGMRVSPITKNGEWRPVAVKLAAALGSSPEYLFPHVVQGIQITRFERELDEDQMIPLMEGGRVLSLNPGDPVQKFEARQRIEEVLASLPERERLLIEMYDIQVPHATLEELGEAIGVSRERARQLLQRARNQVAKTLAHHTGSWWKLTADEKRKLGTKVREELGPLSDQIVEINR